MKKIIKQMDNAKGIVQITTSDERWYVKQVDNKVTGIPDLLFVPSVTWIAGCYPKGISFYKWLANKGWDESQALKEAAGDKGSKVHTAIEDMIHGQQVKMDAKYLNKSTEQQEELTLEEYDCLMGFADWVKEQRPEFLRSEFVVFDDEIGYAGTVDCLCRIGGKVFLVDFKSGQYIWPEYELQLSAYKHALNILGLEMMILQVGYKRNKHAWKETIIEDKFDLFLSAKQIWQNEHGTEAPKQKDYPLELSIPAELCLIDEEEQVKPKVEPIKQAAKKAVKKNENN
jgi:hypothetical protein